ncbi:NAD(P)/FAD-dependent oxidoreductase [Actinophytocola oryzae]|uniref:NAD/ferredoxin-dependent reductase-like protein n=1 Tax=Actinophytocola oryzae TaxID=502181 RepID=A0A4R7W0D8_9PSEU|nr:FAD-dependent oxidoreductase [Actinophytocola oryzae]TDV55963.1 NAD/ferredoxin-dependent reductase-like protein [Actinophytocola oryzae]
MSVGLVPGSVLVVGASVAGLSTVEALRRRGYAGHVTLLGGERHLPYDRPPLSKQVLSGARPADRTTLRTGPALSALRVDLVLDDPAVGLDTATRTVRTAAGRELRADAVVIATGARPRTLPGQDELAGVHVVRTIEDVTALRADLLASARLVVVGEGVLGAEIAATARGMGLAVTVAGPLRTPLAMQVGPVVGELLGDLHTANGVTLRLGAPVAGMTGEHGRVTGVRLATGEVLAADVVVVAIGAVPVTDWLAGSGLTLADGVVCDSRCLAAPGIHAAGDVARWQHEGLGVLTRLENRTNAVEQAIAVADNVLGADRPYSPVPYFWTDQYDVKLQTHGVLPPDADVRVVDGDLDARRFVVQYLRDGRVTGVLGWNMPKQLRLRRQDVVDASALTRP